MIGPSFMILHSSGKDPTRTWDTHGIEKVTEGYDGWKMGSLNSS
jgi:hypothetical protein